MCFLLSKEPASLFCGLGRTTLIAFVETVHASCRIYQLLLPGKERVTIGTDLNMKVLAQGRTRLERVAASADHVDLIV